MGAAGSHNNLDWGQRPLTAAASFGFDHIELSFLNQLNGVYAEALRRSKGGQ